MSDYRPDLDYPWDVLDILEQQALELAHLHGFESIEWRRFSAIEVGLYAVAGQNDNLLIGFEGSIRTKDFSRARHFLPRPMIIPRYAELLLHAVHEIEQRVARRSAELATGDDCLEFVRRYGKWLHDLYRTTHAINRNTLIQDCKHVQPSAESVIYILPGDIRKPALTVTTAEAAFERYSHDGKTITELAFAPEINCLYVRQK